MDAFEYNFACGEHIFSSSAFLFTVYYEPNGFLLVAVWFLKSHRIYTANLFIFTAS